MCSLVIIYIWMDLIFFARHLTWNYCAAIFPDYYGLKICCHNRICAEIWNIFEKTTCCSNEIIFRCRKKVHQSIVFQLNYDNLIIFYQLLANLSPWKTPLLYVLTCKREGESSASQIESICKIVCREHISISTELNSAVSWIQWNHLHIQIDTLPT